MSSGEKTKKLWQDPEYREKMRQKHLGQKNSKESIRLQVENRRRNGWWKDPSKTIKRFSTVRIGVKRPNLSKEKHWNWLNGKSFEPYSKEFDTELREFIRNRDNLQCQMCFISQNDLRTKSNKRCKLSVHHIDYDKKNSMPSNLVSLCKSCHMKTNLHRESWTLFFNKNNEDSFT